MDANTMHASIVDLHAIVGTQLYSVSAAIHL